MRDIFEKWVSVPKQDKAMAILSLVRDKWNLEPCDDLSKWARLTSLELQKKYDSCKGYRTLFLAKNQGFLDTPLTFPEYVTKCMPTYGVQASSSTLVRGRPKKSFEECCARTKRRRVQHLVENYSAEELQFASTAQNTREQKSNPEVLSGTAALILKLDLDLSDKKYNVLRSVVNNVNENLFPSLYSLRKEKKNFLPKIINITDVSASVPLQELLNNTVDSISRLLDLDRNIRANLICKWGFDGSGGHSLYKQRFLDNESTDEYLFLIALVPLKLVDFESSEVLWQNDHPGSTFYCRPIKFIFTKECSSVIISEENHIRTQIENLVNHKLFVKTHTLDVSFVLQMTMVDGSVCNVLTDTNASARCFICGAKPKDMNSINIDEKPPNREHFRFGLSSLHAYIRSMECLLHIAYRLSFKSWQAKGEEKKKLLEAEKVRIRKEFKDKMGLIVDTPKQGYGSSNDGNTARRFFSNPVLTSQITGIDVELVRNLSIILRVLALGRFINIDKFRLLLRSTHELYLSLYGWYYMPSSLHKLLIHGSDIIESFVMPIGHLSEDALEALHKIVRHNRLHHTRKSSRINMCTDLINNLLLMSDPYIASERHKQKKKVTEIDSCIEEYLVPISVNPNLTESEVNRSLAEFDLESDGESDFSDKNFSDSD